MASLWLPVFTPGCSGSSAAATDSSGGAGATAAEGGGTGNGADTAGTTGGGAGTGSAGGTTSGSEGGSSAGGSSDGGAPSDGGTGQTASTGTAGATGSTTNSTGGAASDGGATSGKPLSCDDIGSEPTIPAACSTVLATRTTTNGVPTDESTLDTQQIQAAIDACPAGQSVKLAVDGDRNAFISGPLFLRAGITLWIDAGVTLFASRNPRDFDAKAGQCGMSDTGNSSCNGLINVKVANAMVAGAGAIDGRGGEPVAGDTNTWWALENADDGKLAAPRLVQVSGAQNFTLYQVTLRNSPKFHVVIDGTNGYRVWGVTINTPANAPNTDGVDPSASTNGVIAYSKISTGDDNVAVKGSGPPVVDGLVVAHNHFGRGHGMSIGSETYGGVRNVLVCDLSLDGTDNGLRIKSDSSRGGLVQNVTYTGVCIRNVKKPLVFDPYYSSSTGTEIPDFRDIVVKDVHVLGGGNLTLTGYDAAHPLGITLDNVVFDSAPSVTAQDANITLGPGPVSFTPSGTDVKVTTTPSNGAAPLGCNDAWVTF